MTDKRNIKTKIWIYAVVLFTSAFIVLLITAFSQIRLNKNIVNYKNQINSQQNEKNKYRLSYANAQELNIKLTSENGELQKENESLSTTVDNLNNDLKNAEENMSMTTSQYEKLSEAQLEYLKGNVVSSAQILLDIKPSVFKERASELFSILSGKAFSDAGKLLFNEGYKLYHKDKYKEAIEKFIVSRKFSTKDDYSDNCLYYLAYAYHKTGNTKLALEFMQSLIKEYPSSSFIKYAGSFIQKYN